MKKKKLVGLLVCAGLAGWTASAVFANAWDDVKES